MNNNYAAFMLNQLGMGIAFDGIPIFDKISLTKAIDLAIKALEQQDAKQVELEGDGYADGELVFDFGKCPNCGWDFEYGDKDWEEPFCCHCGQKLSWFEMEGKR